MISDVLSDAILQMDNYLSDPTYGGDLRTDLIALRNKMQSMLVTLDEPPPQQTQQP